MAQICTQLASWDDYELSFVLKEAESQGGKVTRPRSHGSDIADPGGEPIGQVLTLSPL